MNYSKHIKSKLAKGEIAGKALDQKIYHHFWINIVGKNVEYNFFVKNVGSKTLGVAL